MHVVLKVAGEINREPSHGVSKMPYVLNFVFFYLSEKVKYYSFRSHLLFTAGGELKIIILNKKFDIRWKSLFRFITNTFLFFVIWIKFTNNLSIKLNAFGRWNKLGKKFFRKKLTIWFNFWRFCKSESLRRIVNGR